MHVEYSWRLGHPSLGDGDGRTGDGCAHAHGWRFRDARTASRWFGNARLKPCGRERTLPHRIRRAESREPRAESREPRAESREPRAESREPRAESREPRAESREPRAESREPRAESREPRAESREPRAESREPRAESREPRAESREPRLYHRAGHSRSPLSRHRPFRPARHSPAAPLRRGNLLPTLFFRRPAHSVRGTSCCVPGRRGADLSGRSTFLNGTTPLPIGHGVKKLPVNPSGNRSSK